MATPHKSKFILLAGALVMFVISIFSGYLLYNSIASRIAQIEAIKQSESLVIKKLGLIREIQKAHVKKYNAYAPNFDSLKRFVTNDVIYNVAKIETVIPAAEVRAKDEMHLGDSIQITYDTLGSDPVGVSLELAKNFPLSQDEFSIAKLEIIPGKDGKVFKMKVGKINKGSEQLPLYAPVIEVVDEHPVDITRTEDSENPKRRFLRFGSVGFVSGSTPEADLNVSTSGNWED